MKGDRVTCYINGAVVATYPKSALVAVGKLKSTDGVFGVRFAHNTEATVTGLTVAKTNAASFGATELRNIFRPPVSPWSRDAA